MADTVRALLRTATQGWLPVLYLLERNLICSGFIHVRSIGAVSYRWATSKEDLLGDFTKMQHCTITMAPLPVYANSSWILGGGGAKIGSHFLGVGAY